MSRTKTTLILHHNMILQDSINGLDFCRGHQECKTHEFLKENREKNKLKRPTAFTLVIVMELILIIIGLVMLGLVINSNSYESERTVPGVILSVIGLGALAELLLWRKRAFWILIGLSFAALIWALVTEVSILNPIFAFIGIGVLYAVMQQQEVDGEKIWNILY